MALAAILPKLRRVITHDTARFDVPRNAGLSQEGLNNSGLNFYVQNLDQKIAAIVAGIGIGHLPRSRIAEYLSRGELKILNIASEAGDSDNFIAWKIANKGKGLQTLTQQLMAVKWT